MRRVLTYIAGFGVARGVLFFSPIVLANLVPIELYGRLELTQSVAALGALVLGLGLQASVPLVLLRAEVRARWDTLLALVVGLAIVLLILSAANALIFESGASLPVLVPLAIAILLLQGVWATKLKAHGRGTGAVFLEAGFWVSAVLGGALIAWLGVYDSILGFTLSTYVALLLAWTLRAYLAERTDFDLADVRENLRVSVPLMIIGVLSVLVISSSRLVLGYASTIEIVGLYAILYRATALPIVGHQLLIIGFFRAIFSWDEATLKRRARVIPVGVTVFALLFWLLVDHVGFLLGPRFDEAFADYRVASLLILTQTVLWSAIALNDLVNSRLLIARHVARYSAIYLILALPALTTVTAQSYVDGDPARTLLTFTLWHSGLMLGYYVTQCIAIWRNGHRYFLLWASALGCYAALVCIIFVGEMI